MRNIEFVPKAFEEYKKLDTNRQKNCIANRRFNKRYFTRSFYRHWKTGAIKTSIRRLLEQEN